MIVCFSGPSGIGKGYVKEQLLQLYPSIKELVWYTTRTLRPNESGGNRAHISHPDFSQMEAEGQLVLVQDLFGHRYGLRKDDLCQSSAVRLTELHPAVVQEAREITQEILVIGFVTRDLSLLRKRLSVVRKTESPAEIEKRVAMAEKEINMILDQKFLFASVIEVSEATEHQVLDEVLQVLKPQIEKEGGKS